MQKYIKIRTQKRQKIKEAQDLSGFIRIIIFEEIHLRC
jgi:hypothetical protein